MIKAFTEAAVLMVTVCPFVISTLVAKLVGTDVAECHGDEVFARDCHVVVEPQFPEVTAGFVLNKSVEPVLGNVSAFPVSAFVV